MKKVARLLNYLWMKGGEARLGVKALAKMGFPDHNSRKHLELLADAGIVQRLKGYSPVMGRGIRHRLTKRTMTMFGTVKRKSETA
jgi:predicted ArsR family transcriptional regulator